jgi:5-methylcytosine-specific restriction enzyme A
MNYPNISEFYKENESKLISEHGIYRPVKSITRNIFNSVSNFYNWYFKNSKNIITYDEICNEIVGVSEDTGRSTIIDNIRNMKELAFLVEDPNNTNLYHFTRNFVNYVMNGDELEETIIKNLKNISSIDQMTMFYNYILCTLREGISYGNITLYPDSETKFKNIVSDKKTRIKLMERVYEIYGFHGNGNLPSDDNYTPNINYRIVSTMKQLGLIEDGEKNQYGLQTYNISILGKEVLNQIELNLKSKKKGIETIESYERSEKFIEAAIQMNPDNDAMKEVKEQLSEIIYELKSEEYHPSLILDESIDKPVMVSLLTTSYERNPQKAANAKAIADYKCEFDEEHKTFTSEVNNNQYVEAHHLIPISEQGHFQYGIDVEANIVALCPVCHRKIHYAIEPEKEEMLEKLYSKRIERIKKCGIDVTFDELVDIYNGEKHDNTSEFSHDVSYINEFLSPIHTAVSEENVKDIYKNNVKNSNNKEQKDK